MHLAQLKNFFPSKKKAKSVGKIYVIFTLKVSILEEKKSDKI